MVSCIARREGHALAIGRYHTPDVRRFMELRAGWRLAVDVRSRVFCFLVEWTMVEHLYLCML